MDIEGDSVENAVVEENIVEEVKYAEEPWTPCDSCRVAQATWKIIGDSGVLFFCGHHKNAFEAGMSTWAKETVDLSVL